MGINAPNDGFQVNLGNLSTVGETTQQDLGEVRQPSQQPSTNSLFNEAKLGIPAAIPSTRKSEFREVLRPFTASYLVMGIEGSHGNIGAVVQIEVQFTASIKMAVLLVIQ